MGPTARFDNFTVQLKSLDVDRYAHLAIEIEVADETAKGTDRTAARRPSATRSCATSATAPPTSCAAATACKHDEGDRMIKKLDELVPGHRIRASTSPISSSSNELDPHLREPT